MKMSLKMAVLRILPLVLAQPIVAQSDKATHQQGDEILNELRQIRQVLQGGRGQPAEKPSPDQDLSGTWSFAAPEAHWEVDWKLLNKSGDDFVYCGTAKRKEKDKDGRDVTMEEVCGANRVKENKLLVAFGRAITCEAPYKKEGAMEARCAFLGQVSVSYVITRLTSK